MSNARYLVACALLVPLLSGGIISAEAAKSKKTAKQDVTAIRAQCMGEAQAAAAQTMGEIAEKNERGTDAYHACVRKYGVKP